MNVSRRTALAAGLLITATGSPCAARTSLTADIIRTRYGIPHVTAKDYASLGYGAGFAFAQDNFCLLADQIVTVNGQRSRYFGPEATTTVSFAQMKNLDTDLYFKATLDLPQLRHALRSTSREYRQMLTGYAAGYNRYLRQTGMDGLPLACRNAPWVRPMRQDDLLRLNEEKMTLAGSGNWISSIVNAAPPSKLSSASISTPYRFSGLIGDSSLGSNGWALGRDATGGPGVLLGNPHFPWETTNRFYQIQLTIPGELNVMGASSSALPGVSIGFNKDVAWTHTVSTDRHFTLFELKLDPANPTAYYIDGRRTKMTRQVVSIEVRGGPSVIRTFYRSKFGPMLVNPMAGLRWDVGRAFTLRDANRYNLRAGDTWLNINRARTVAEIRQALGANVGLPWVNTLAADRNGDVLYADITATPNVSGEKVETCASSAPAAATFAAMRIFILDGSRGECDWTADAASPVPGLKPESQLPSAVRRDFVANSNDSYWLANDVTPLTGFAPIIGLTGRQQNLRTRAGLITIHREIEAASARSASIGLETVKAMIFENRSYAAELILDDALLICAERIKSGATGASAGLVDACRILGKWDRRMNTESVGVPLFIEFWGKLRTSPEIYSVPFDKNDPVHTPHGLKRDPATAEKVVGALVAAVLLLKERGVELNAPWGTLQVAVRGGARIPVHGGPGDEAGVLNSQESKWVPGVGYVPYHGSSYVQAVTFDNAGPVADGILIYSQSTDPASPHYADQTRLFAEKKWNRLPFSAAAIQQDKISEIKINE